MRASPVGQPPKDRHSWSRGRQPNDCPIHTIATIEAFIRRIDNCVNLKSGDVALKNLNTYMR